MRAKSNVLVRLVVMLALGGIVAACGGGSGGSVIVAPPPPSPPPPPPPMQTSFDQFVQNQFAASADDTDPQQIDTEDFMFDENPSAFDNLLQ